MHEFLSQFCSMDLVDKYTLKRFLFNIQDLWQGMNFSLSKAEARVDVC